MFHVGRRTLWTWTYPCLQQPLSKQYAHHLREIPVPKQGEVSLHRIRELTKEGVLQLHSKTLHPHCPPSSQYQQMLNMHRQKVAHPQLPSRRVSDRIWMQWSSILKKLFRARTMIGYSLITNRRSSCCHSLHTEADWQFQRDRYLRKLKDGLHRSFA